MSPRRDDSLKTDAKVAKYVRAAGGVIQDDRGYIAIVFRPSHDDWSLPKGKVEPGELRVEAALREVREETGLSCGIVGHAADVRYTDRKGRAKRVRYYRMVVLSGEFVANDETSELRWIGPQEVEQLTYEVDRELVAGVWSKMAMTVAR